MPPRLLTSESVTEGHPDKIADQISDAVLDATLERDPTARVACEVLTTTGLVLVAGEITTHAVIDIPALARGTLRSIGYTDADFGIGSESCSVMVALGRQSPDIAAGVDPGGAGDQGMMFGYASDETAEFMPMPILLAHRLTARLSRLRRTGRLPWLRPDGKAQVTVEYDGDRPLRVSAIVLSTQHAPELTLETVRAEVLRRVIRPAIPRQLLDLRHCLVHINPTGRFVIGGPHGDTGLTGRKIIVDTYGGAARHGGGAFSGKDPSKVDRSAAYAARWVAKNVVAAGLARRCEVSIAYAIGVAEPVAVGVETFGTGAVPEERIVEAIRGTFDLSPQGIIDRLGLRAPIYRTTAAYGHFGRAPYAAEVGGRRYRFFPWEALDRVDELREKVHG